MSIASFSQLPANMSNIKSKDISEVQLLEFINKANSSGLSETQIIQEFTRRGMDPNEISVIKSRISQITPQSNSSQNAITTKNNVTRTFSNSGNSFPISNSNSNGAILGAELFSNPSLSFEPDLRIATPKNYSLGVSDKLLLDIYGINLSQQPLEISPEGTVNLKYAGPVYINGLTIEEASKRINTSLAKFYPAISSGKTKAQLSLTGIRSIKVILVGAVKKPGAYTLSSLATLFNALFISGGPADNGSFRNIELVRNNKPILTADLYDFLLKADQSSNISLKDNDVIRIPFANTKVSIDGEVNRPGIFELQPKETLLDVLSFAGGYKSTAYKTRISGIRETDFEKQILDIIKDSISNFRPQNGDSFSVGTILNRFQNLITIQGSVFKPGTYSFEKGMTVRSLIIKAEGLKEDAYSGRALIIRTRENLTKEYINISLESDSLTSKYLLQKDDIVQVSSIFDIKDKYTVTINGAVRNPNTFTYEDSLTLKSIILKAGGFADNATGMGIEISRRKRDIDINNPQSPIVELITINDNKDLSNFSKDVLLKPFDIVTVKFDPSYKTQISVSIIGEVLNPGNYTLTSRSEKISDVLKRAGSILYTANIEGAKLIRRNYTYKSELEMIEKIVKTSAKDSSGLIVENEEKPFREVTIALTKILERPGSKEDIFLEEGDQIIIPAFNNMISVSGEVLNPLSISYDESKSLKNYLYDAGGISKEANKNKIFVVYPNGKASATKHIFLFFRKYPRVTAGSKIFIPKQPEKKGTDYAKAGIVISAVSAFVTSIALAYQITK